VSLFAYVLHVAVFSLIGFLILSLTRIEHRYDKYVVIPLQESPMKSDEDLRADSISVGIKKHPDPKLYEVGIYVLKPGMEAKATYPTTWTQGQRLELYSNDKLYKLVHRTVSLEVMAQIMTFNGINPHLKFEDISQRLQLYAATLHSVNIDRYLVLESGSEIMTNTLELSLLRVQKERLRHSMMKNFPWAPVLSS